jgi:Acetoacetate decarboxylase (ADC)
MSAASRYEIQGRTVSLPVEVRRATSATALWQVPAAAVAALLPDDAFEPLELGDGHTQLVLGLIDYQDNDLGDYREVGIIFFVRPRGAGPEEAGTYIWKLPVDQSFTCEAGCTIWGFPKTVERIEYETGADRLTGSLWMGGRRVFTLTVPIGGTPVADATTSGFTYTHLRGAPHRTPMTTGGAAALNPAGPPVSLELGDHPVADALRSLGLPKPPALVTWVPHMRGHFGVPEKL